MRKTPRVIERGFQSKEEAEVIFERGLKKKGGTTPYRGGKGWNDVVLRLKQGNRLNRS